MASSTVSLCIKGVERDETCCESDWMLSTRRGVPSLNENQRRAMEEDSFSSAQVASLDPAVTRYSIVTRARLNALIMSYLEMNPSSEYPVRAR